MDRLTFDNVRLLGNLTVSEALDILERAYDSLHFDIYTGKKIGIPTEMEKAFGKSTAPLITLLADLPEGFTHLPYHVYLDNLFTSFNVLEHLKNNGYNAAGTLKENRIPKDCPLPSKKVMSSSSWGTFHYRIDHTDGIFICKWQDNKSVAIASTAYGVTPRKPVQRYSRSTHQHIQVPQPHALLMYNKNMGGTDRMDQDVARYMISIRGKKWWWVLFIWLIDGAANSAWCLHRASGRKIPKLEFIREIATYSRPVVTVEGLENPA